MISLDFIKNRQNQFIIVALILTTALALWIRLLPMFNMGSNVDILTMVASDDPLYNLRQTEQLLVNSLQYAWYDPMSLFPTGTRLYWGPLFPMIVAVACMITGAATRPEIIATALLVPPLMGAAMVPVVYYIGKIWGDWKTGLVAAILIAIVSGQYFFRSMYGYMDHHMAEVLFSTIFCLAYMYTLDIGKDAKIVLKDPKTYKMTALLSVITGVMYLIGLFVMPTMILFAMIVGIYTILQFIVDGFRGRTSEYLVVINTITFAVISITMLVFGINISGIDLATYSIGHVYAYALIILSTIALYAIYHRFGKNDALTPLLVIGGAGVAVVIALAVFLPSLYQLFIISSFAFFGQQAITNTVQEAMPWSSVQAWATFGIGLFLMVGGLIVMAYRNLKNEHPYHIFGVIWTVVVFYSTWQHVRYEYYLAVPLVLVAAVGVSFALNLSSPNLSKFAAKLSKKEDEEAEEVISPAKKEKMRNKKTRKQSKVTEKSDGGISQLKTLVMFGALAATFLFGYYSFMGNYNVANSAGMRMNGDWKESLDWMYNNTPDTGVNYTQIYDQTTFQYPSTAYGVMSWWDYGHMITYIAKRIPNANPFQYGITGERGSATFFMAPTEADANKVMDAAGTKFIITDIEMDVAKFWAMATWYNSTAGGVPYQALMLTPQNTIGGGYQQVQVYTSAYFDTMISRLHNFDGSLVDPQTTYYVEYMDPSVSQVSLPVITAATSINVSDADMAINDYNAHAIAGYHATVISPMVFAPTHKIPALQHYRLVHESPTNVINNPPIDIKYVKTFEYVKGAHISGNGLIGINLVSNTGRNFTYLQESVNGEWILPYSTQGNPYDVRAISKWHGFTTGMEYDVPEFAVTLGMTIG